MPIKQHPFGTLADGRAVDLFTLDNGKGLVAKITNFGGRITELHVPSASGPSSNIVLGFDSFEPYAKQNPYFGAVVGRFANRIAKGKFSIDGQEYQIPQNNGENALHGGPVGFDKLLWRASPSDPNGTPTLRLALDSPDGDQGFPGNVETRITYSLTDKNELRIDYVATTDKPTIINLSNHSYFNLAGPGSGTVLDHAVQIQADRYTPVSPALIPTGEIALVKDTPFDFTTPRVVGERIEQVANGYDHNFVFNNKREPGGAAAGPVVRVTHEKARRGIEVTTDQPAVQFYTGGFLNGSITGIGGVYPRFGGFCLETQHFPDSPNHKNFPNTILRPGETFTSTTVYRFFTL
ncbi:MAG TPA: aldose epimerase family protein [Tepidisphaeraceae bacterium]|jgi:aldose 1-epimerase